MNSTDDLRVRLAQIAERAKQRNRERAPEPAPKPAKVTRLPLWPEEVRACPSSVLRSALFGIVRRGRRKALEGEILATWEGVTIRYTGWRLDQGDLDNGKDSGQKLTDPCRGALSPRRSGRRSCGKASVY